MMKRTFIAASVLVVISGFASSAFAAHDIHSKEARDGKKAFGGYADYSRAVKSMGEARVDHAVREALGRDHGDGRYNAAEHDLSGARDSIHNALETGDIAKIKAALGDLAAAGGAHDAKTIAQVADIQRQIQMTEYNAHMAALRAAHSAAVSGTYTPATQAQIDRAAQMTQAKLESGTSVADMMGHIAEQMASGKVDPTLTSAERAVVHTFAMSRNTAPAELTPEQAHAAMNGIAAAYGKLQAGQITVGQFQQHIDEQKASGAVHKDITNLEQKMLNSFVTSRFNVVIQHTQAPSDQTDSQTNPSPAQPTLTSEPGFTGIDDQAVTQAPVTHIAPASPVSTHVMTDVEKARLAQMIADMKAQGVTSEQIRQTVNAFVASGKNEAAMMVSNAFGLTQTIAGSPTNPSFSGGSPVPPQSILTGQTPQSIAITTTPTLPGFSGGNPVPQQSVLTGETPKNIVITTSPTLPSYTGGYPVPQQSVLTGQTPKSITITTTPTLPGFSGGNPVPPQSVLTGQTPKSIAITTTPTRPGFSGGNPVPQQSVLTSQPNVNTGSSAGHTLFGTSHIHLNGHLTYQNHEAGFKTVGCSKSLHTAGDGACITAVDSKHHSNS